VRTLGVAVAIVVMVTLPAVIIVTLMLHGPEVFS